MTNTTNQQIEWNTIEELCDREFGSRPSPSNLATLKKIEGERTEVREFVDRVFSPDGAISIRSQGYSAIYGVDTRIHHSWWSPRGLGRTHPTMDFRGSSSIDRRVHSSESRVKLGPGTTLLEMGCGFVLSGYPVIHPSGCQQGVKPTVRPLNRIRKRHAVTQNAPEGGISL